MSKPSAVPGLPAMPDLAGEQLRGLLDVGRAVMSDLDLDSVLARVLEAACALTGAQFAAIGVLASDRKSLERFVTRGIDAQTQRHIGEMPSGHGVSVC